MSERRWYRSLYWRIALGLMAFLALMLAAQSALFVWMLEQSAGSMPARSPRRVAGLVASDLGTALSADPSIDLNAYVRDQYGHIYQSFVVIMRDGGTFANHDDVPAELREAIVVETARLHGEPRGRRPERGRGGPGGPDRPRGGPGGPDRPWESAPIFVDGSMEGRVAVRGGPPLTRMLEQWWPRLTLAAVSILVVGVTLIALVVFGPARRRLSAVQTATNRLGAGDFAARAPEHGGDEVAAVARSFNRMADELVARAQALETSDRVRRQLLADVSHELMTPLTAMRGYIETLTMSELTLDEATRGRYLRIIEDETHRLEGIVGDLLDLAKLEGGGAPLAREAIAVAALFERVRARHERESRERSITITCDVGPGADTIGGDPNRLEQALQNLAANALRHTPDGGTISLSSTLEDGRIHLRVRDSGSGIAAEHLPLVFDRFYKADTSRRAAGGSGLGLSIVKAIVERHGGSVSVRNDRGAVFDIALPHG